MIKRISVLMIAIALGAALLSACGGAQSAQTDPSPQPAVTDGGQAAAPSADETATDADMPPLPPAPTATVPPVPPTTQGIGPDTLLNADFGSRALDGWSIVNLGTMDEAPASWIVADGHLVQNGDSLSIPSDFETVAKAGDNKWGNYSLSAQLLSTGGDLMGVTFRHSGAGYYKLTLAAKAPNDVAKLTLEKVVAGKTTVLGQNASWPGYDTNVWQAVNVTVVGDGITVSVGGQQVFDVKDASLANGAVGMYAVANGGAWFDNVVVTQK